MYPLSGIKPITILTVTMKPEKFNGTEDAVTVCIFLTVMSIYLWEVDSCSCGRLGDQGRIYYFTRRLTGKAYEWSRRVNQESLSYVEFVKLFKRRFNGPEQIMPVLIKLRHHTQDESLESYNDKFTCFAAAIPDSWLAPQAKLSFYLDGLKEPLQENAEDLKTAIKLSVERQDSYRESEKKDEQSPV